MGCGCPGSFSEGKSNKKHKETQDTAKGEKSD